jgi:hypothetical protein
MVAGAVGVVVSQEEGQRRLLSVSLLLAIVLAGLGCGIFVFYVYIVFH